MFCNFRRELSKLTWEKGGKMYMCREEEGGKLYILCEIEKF